MNSKGHSVDFHNQAVLRHRSGQGYKSVYKALNIYSRTVATRTLPRAGHLAKLSNQVKRALVRKVNKNAMTTLTELQDSSGVMGEPARNRDGN